MKAKDLIKLLEKFPEYEVKAETAEIIDDIDRVEMDCFDEDEGICFVIVLDEASD